MVARWLLFFICFPGLVFGQTNDRRRYTSEAFNREQAIRGQLADATWKMGSFFATPLLGINGLGYDSNIFSAEVGEVSDYFLSPELGFQTYLVPNKRWVWANRVSTSYLYYFDLENLRGFQYSGESRLYGLFKRIYFDAGVDVDRSQQRINSEIDLRGFNESFAADFTAVLQPVRRGSLKITGSFEKLEYDREVIDPDQDFRALEREVRTYGLVYLHKLKTVFWPFVEFQRSENDFAATDNPRDDASLTSAFSGIRNEYGYRFHYNARVGITRMNFPRSGGFTKNLLALRIFSAYNLSRRLSIEAGAEQQPVFSSFASYNYYLSQRVFLGFKTIARSRWDFGPLFRVGTNDYRDSRQFEPQPRRDDLIEVGLRIGFPYKKTLRASLTLSYQDRDSNIPGQSDRGFAVTSSLRPSQF